MVYADEVNQSARRKPGTEQSWVASSGQAVAGCQVTPLSFDASQVTPPSVVFRMVPFAPTTQAVVGPEKAAL